MKIIAIVAAKGGVGKTTLAAGLATAALAAWPDAKIALVDLDPQGSLTGWWNARTVPQPAIYDLAGRSLRSSRRDLRRAKLDLVIVDCPPGFAEIHRDAIAVGIATRWCTVGSSRPASPRRSRTAWPASLLRRNARFST